MRDDLFQSDGHRGYSWRETVMLVVPAACLLAGLALLSVAPAKAHSWFTGETDPVSGLNCCDDRDCFEIADTDVQSVAGGYVYRPFDDGSGPSQSNPGFVPAARVKSSHSYGYAVCIGGGSAGMYGVAVQPFVRCFFAPSGF